MFKDYRRKWKVYKLKLKVHFYIKNNNNDVTLKEYFAINNSKIVKRNISIKILKLPSQLPKIMIKDIDCSLYRLFLSFDSFPFKYECSDDFTLIL